MGGRSASSSTVGTQSPWEREVASEKRKHEKASDKLTTAPDKQQDVSHLTKEEQERLKKAEMEAAFAAWEQFETPKKGTKRKGSKEQPGAEQAKRIEPARN